LQAVHEWIVFWQNIQYKHGILATALVSQINGHGFTDIQNNI
jgi:hypothetical protein